MRWFRRRTEFEDNYVTEERLTGLGWAPALAKAAGDEFDYALRHRWLGVIRFSHADEAGPGWVRLHGTEVEAQEYVFRPMLDGVPFCRGIEIRLCDIIWVADAPEGS